MCTMLLSMPKSFAVQNTDVSKIFVCTVLDAYTEVDLKLIQVSNPEILISLHPKQDSKQFQCGLDSHIN